MKFDIDSIKEVEEREGVKCCASIRKESTAIYQRILNAGLSQYWFNVKTTKGKDTRALFITLKDYEEITKTREIKPKRGFRGPPYLFCKDCPHMCDCTLEIPCEKRDTEIKKKALRAVVQGDDRFWKNGKPKKSKILCQFSKYLYAHTGVKKGECQKEKCEFYRNGKCDINLDR